MLEVGNSKAEINKVEETYKIESKTILEVKSILQKQKEMNFYINISKD